MYFWLFGASTPHLVFPSSVYRRSSFNLAHSLHCFLVHCRQCPKSDRKKKNALIFVNFFSHTKKKKNCSISCPQRKKKAQNVRPTFCLVSAVWNTPLFQALHCGLTAHITLFHHSIALLSAFEDEIEQGANGTAKFWSQDNRQKKVSPTVNWCW